MRRVQMTLFFVYLVVVWAVMPLWAWSTWRHRKSLYVRVRQPVWLLADLALALALVTLICLKHVLPSLGRGRQLPCGLTNAAAAVSMVWVPGVMLCGNLELWYASTIMDGRRSRLLMLRRFRLLLCGALLVLTLVGVLMTTRPGHLCRSDVCLSQCPWAAQYFVLLPLGLICWTATLISWRLLASTGRMNRLGLLAEFWHQALVSLPLWCSAFGITITIDFGAVEPGPHWHSLDSALWLLTFTSRFVILHVLPSISYGYSPRQLLCNRGAAQVLPLPSALHVPLLPPTAEERDRRNGHQILNEAVGPGDGPLPKIRPFVATDGGCYELPAVTYTSREGSEERSLFSGFNQYRPSTHRASLSSVSEASIASLDSARLSNASNISGPGEAPGVLGVLPVALAELYDVGSVLKSGHEGLVGDLLCFCRTLLCDHWVLFLMALHPYFANRLLPDDLPPLLPLEIVQGVYALFLSPDAPLLAPVDSQVLRSIRYNCDHLEVSKQTSRKLRLRHRVSTLRQSATPRSVRSGFTRLFAKIKLHGKESAGTSDLHEDINFLIARSFQLAYEQVAALLSEEAIPLFKVYLEARESRGMAAHRTDLHDVGTQLPSVVTEDEGMSLNLCPPPQELRLDPVFGHNVDSPEPDA